MNNNDELWDALDAVHFASAKRKVLSDLCSYFETYIRKQKSQMSDVTRKLEKAKKANRKDMEYYRVATNREKLQCQMIEALNLQKEFLKRCINASEEEVKARDHFKEVKKKTEDNSSEEDSPSVLPFAQPENP